MPVCSGLVNSLDKEPKRAAKEALREDELALFDLLQKDELDKTSRERVKQASRDLLASIKTRLDQLDRSWEKEQTKADIEVFILDEVFASLPPPPFTSDEKKALASNGLCPRLATSHQGRVCEGRVMAWFRRHIGADYSGAQTPAASLNGLRVFMTEGDRPPAEVLPPPSPRKYWTRRDIAEWLVELGALPLGHRNCSLCFTMCFPNCDFREAIQVHISANILI